MSGKENPCAKGLTPECFEKYPKYAKKVFAYKLLQAVIGSPLSADLQKMLWRHLVQVPISWMSWEDFIIPDDIPLEEIIPEDWYPDGPLPDELTINLNELIPDDYEEDDPLPDGVTIDPGTEIPNDWKVGDEIPEGVTINPGKLFPDDWTASDPLPEGIVINIDVVLPKVWTVGEDLPFGITVDPDFKIETAMLETLGIYIEEGKTYEGLFGTGWDPTSELPSGSSWKPYKKDEVIIESAVPPLYLPVFEPGPVHRPIAEVALTETTVEILVTAAEVLRGKLTAGWGATRNQPDANSVLLKTMRGTAAYIDEWENDYHLNRSILKFSLAGIPFDANIKSGELWIWPYNDSPEEVCIQSAPEAEWLNVSDYSKMAGAATSPVVWTTGKQILSLNAEILADLNEKIGADAYIMTRDYSYDYIGATPPAETCFNLEYYIYIGGTTGKTPAISLTYES